MDDNLFLLWISEVYIHKARDNARLVAVRQIFPAWIEDIDPFDIYMHEPRLPPAGRPWVMTNMIASIDGATAIAGLSGDLGDQVDSLVLHALRASCDWIVVGSQTANAERYRVPRCEALVVERRLGSGLGAAPRLAIVTASGALDPTIPALSDSAMPATLVIAGTQADPDRFAGLNAEVVRLPMPTPQPAAVLDELHKRGAAIVLCEGGPTWNGQMASANLIDEMCVTISPILVGGDSSRLIAGATQAIPTQMHLRRLLTENSLLFARYTRA